MTRAAGALRGLGKVAEYWPISVHITSTCGSGYAACRSASVRSVILAEMHDIEVEDDVTAYAEYANGATGVFITSTGEAPGTNRLEISADNGKVVLEGGKITFWRTRVPSSQFLKEWPNGFGSPEVWKCEVPFRGEERNIGVLQKLGAGDPSGHAALGLWR